MPSESDLRDLLQGSDPEGRAAIDLDAVLTRARRRRRPKVLAAQALGSVAVVGALFTAVVAVQPPQQVTQSVAEEAAGGSAADSAPHVDDTALRMSDALLLNTCGQPVSDLVTADAPILTVDPVATDAGTNPVPVTVVLHGGAVPGRGVSSSPVLTITRDGIVVGQPTAIDAIGIEVDLPADGTFVYETTTFAVSCDPAYVGGLEALPPGDYEIRAAVDFIGEGSESGSVFVGPPSTFEIR